MILHYQNKSEAIAASRAGAQQTPFSENRLLCRALGKFMVFADSRDISQTPYLSMDGIVNPHLTELLCEHVKPGMACVDVGAAFGYQTLLMADLVGPAGKVFAYEPNPRMFMLLKRTLELNNFSTRVTPYPDAVGDSSSLGELATHKQRFTGATLSVAAKASFGEGGKENVQISTLDERLGSRGIDPDFYAIDTIGYEPQVWSGMQGLLKKKRHVTILMELTPKWYADAESLMESIFDQGFNVHRIVDGESARRWEEPNQFLNRHRSTLLLTR